MGRLLSLIASLQRGRCEGTRILGKMAMVAALLFFVFVASVNTECIPTSGPGAGKKCVFPFTMKDGKTCTGPKCCNLDGASKGDWCSTKVDKNGVHIRGNYGYCNPCDKGYVSLGCYKDSRDRDLPVRRRKGKGKGKGTINRCYEMARGGGYTYFGLQNNGDCHLGFNYGKYGKTGGCRNGMGGYWKNGVYRISDGDEAIKKLCSTKTFSIPLLSFEKSKFLKTYIGAYTEKQCREKCANWKGCKEFLILPDECHLTRPGGVTEDTSRIQAGYKLVGCDTKQNDPTDNAVHDVIEDEVVKVEHGGDDETLDD